MGVYTLPDREGAGVLRTPHETIDTSMLAAASSDAYAVAKRKLCD